jgi:hypothetical protein
MRRLLVAVLVTASAASALVGTATPGAAASAASTRYAATWTFDPRTDGTPSVVADLRSGLQLTDYTGATYYDRITGSHSGSSISVGGKSCRQAASDPTLVTLYGAETTWARMPVLSSQGARVNISCVIDGAHHRFHWGNHGTPDAGYDNAKTTNCVLLTRPAATTFTLDTSRCAVTQDVVYNGRLKQVGAEVTTLIPFTATVTVPGLA